MRTRTLQFATIGILLSSLLLSTVTVSAQTASNDWSRLNAVPAGSKVSVKLKSGKTIDGTLNSVSDTTLSLTVKKAAQDLRREDVATVYHLKKKSAGKETLIGMGVGAGAGAAIGLAGDTADENNFFDTDGLLTAAGAVIGGGIGALSGFLIGRSGRKRMLVYEAK
jgi:small nuclear ribonucleoprotein (snRNP)-like protein